jgi:hypothetical protein
MRMPRRPFVVLATALAVTAGLAGWAGWSLAAAVKTYQFTGVVTEVDTKEHTITVDKGGDAWQFTVEDKKIPRVKKGDRVTIHYTMTARKIEPQK